jgi:hypothetical protein
MRTPSLAVLCFAVFRVVLASAAPMGTAFTYQGKLTEGGLPCDGSYDLQFVACDAEVGGNPLGPVLTNTAVPVRDGLFTVLLDFGSGVFDGESR